MTTDSQVSGAQARSLSSSAPTIESPPGPRRPAHLPAATRAALARLRRRRALTAVALSAVALAGTASGVVAVTGFGAAAATPGVNSDFDCYGGTIYTVQRGSNSTTGQDTTNGSLYAVPTGAMSGTTALTDTLITTIPKGGYANALGITQGGAAAYAVDQTTGAGATTVNVYGYDALTSTWTTYTGTAPANAAFVAGAVDQQNGIYYYATYDGTNDTATVYGFNTNTNKAISGTIATLSLPTSTTGSANGDIAFDLAGDLYVITSVGTSAGLGVVKGPFPSTGSATPPTLTDTTLQSYSDPTSDGYNGIAFDNYGRLYIQYSDSSTDDSYIEQLNPNTGAILNGPAQQSTATYPDVDLGACSLNPTLQVAKDIVSRAAPTDQFGLSITGGSITQGNTATTTGSTLGLQSAEAGPVVGVSGTTYTVAETAASGSLANYSTTYTCTNAAAGGATVTSGTGSSFNLDFPDPGANQTGPFVTCTFTNTADPTVVLDTALGGNRYNTGDQFTAQIQNTSGTVLNATTHSTSTGTGSTVTSGSGTTGTYEATAGTTYDLTETAASGSLANYVESITCTDANGVQSGLPTDQTFTGSYALVPVAGAALTCTITNTPDVNTLTIAKTSTTAVVQSVGQVVPYSFLVTDTGNTTLTGISVSDTQTSPSLGSSLSSIDCPQSSLAAGSSETCTANYTVTAADLANGSVKDSATASGTSPAGSTITSSPSALAIPASSITLTKSASPTTVATLGQKVTYSYLVKNTGAVTLSSIQINDSHPGLTGLSCPQPSLAASATETCTASYAVTQADLDAGTIVNTATAQGVPAGSTTTLVSATSTATVTATASPAITLTKSASVNYVHGGSVAQLGDTIAWSYLVDNTGNVTLTGIAVNDPKAGTVTCADASLAPAATETCTALTAYPITQADVDAGVVDNTATATGTPPSGPAVTSSPSSTSTPVAQSSSLTIVKSASVDDVNGDGQTDLGDTISWSYLVTNTGTVTLTSVAVNDPVAGPVTCPDATLVPGAAQTCTADATHTIDQADVDAGVVNNTATATADPPQGSPITSSPSSTSTPVVQTSGLTIVKSASVDDVNGDGQTDLGDTISWSYLVTNTGTVTLTSVAVNDPVAGPVTCPDATLAPGAAQTCTADATHTIDQADVDAGVVNNTATATADPPQGSPITSSPSSTSTPVAQSSGISIVKSASVDDVNGDGVTDLGDTIAWSYLVTNTGMVTLTAVGVSDPEAGSVTCPDATLAPGAAQTCMADVAYAISQADVDAGVVNNTATATGTPPSGPAIISSPSSTSTPVAQSSAITIVKSASVDDVNGDGSTDLGDTISWSYVVTNAGTVTLGAIGVNDPVAGSVTCPDATLAPGAAQTCTADAVHTITQGDVDAGVVNNTATASGIPPQGPAVTSPPSSTSTPVAQTGTISIVKSASVDDVNNDGETDLGDTISWSYLVTNTGTVTLSTVAVDDPMAGAIDCPVQTLAPGAAETCTADTSYTIGQADVDAGVVNNTATASANPPQGPPVTSAPSSTSTPVFQNPQIAVVKSATIVDANGDGKIDAADTITWTYLVTNTGNVTLSGVTVNDPSAGGTTCPAPTLAPGASETCTANLVHTITQADVDAGVVNDTATATGTPPSGPHVTSSPVTSPPSSTSTPISYTLGLGLVKSASVDDVNNDGITDLGDTIAWSYLVTNSGSVTLTSVGVTDPLAGPVSCPDATVAPGADETCTADTPYTITQADVDAGVVNNTATAQATPPSGPPINSAPSSTSTPVGQVSSLSIVKSASVDDVNNDGETDLGDTIAWSYLVTNTGTVTLSAVGVTDPMAGAVTCPDASLAPGAAQTCTADTPYTITQTDVDAGVVNNTATSTGTPPSGPPVTSPPSSTSTPVAQSSGISIVKSASVDDVNGDGETDLGDTITWSYLVTNAGTVTLSAIGVTDPMAGTVTCPDATLAPGASETCTAAAYTITQADVDAGVVNNTATTTGTPPSGPPVTSPPSSTSTPVAQSSGISIVKSASVDDVNNDGVTDLGDTISWSYLVTNTGTVTLSAIGVTDPMAGTVTCPDATVAPGASETCTSGAYTITQADVDAGVVNNTATATGTPPSGPPVTSPPSSTSTPVAQSSGISMVKSASVDDVNNDGVTDLGDTISWSYLVTNTGTVTLTSVGVTDPMAGLVTCPDATLAPGAAQTCTAAAYTIGQADVDAGVVNNTATATGTPPSGPPVTSPPSSTSTPVAQSSSLTIIKSASVDDVNGDGETDLGDSITWSYLVTNTGTVTLSAIGVTDPMAGAVTCPDATLAPGAAQTCTAAAYTIGQADVDAGVVNNTATSTGTPPSGPPVTSPPSSTSTPVAQSSGLTIVKSANVGDVNGDGETDLGDTITWSYLVTNTGTVTLSAIGVTDPMAGAVSCPDATLAPGAAQTCTAAAYTITQADVDAGVVNNTATSTGTPPSGPPVTSPPSSTSTPVYQNPGLTIVKSASVDDVNNDGVTDLGDTITWSYLVTNTGTVTLSAIGVTDPMAGAVTCPDATLAPGAAQTCTAAAYTITQADVDAGVVNNTATSTGTPPSGPPVTSPPSSTSTPVAQSPGLTIVKAANVDDVNGDGKTDLGDTITWSYLVTNTGTVTLSAIGVTDPMAGTVTCPDASLAPDASETCLANAVYTITQTDVDAGVVNNTATATGTPPSGPPVTSPPSSTSTPVAQSSSLTIVKSASVTDVNGTGITQLGDTIAWSYLVTNTGTVTLSAIGVVDPEAGAVTCPDASLAPDASETCLANAVYTITQTDVDAGVVNNTATATGTPPSGPPVTSPPSSTSTPVAQSSGISIVKSATIDDVNGDGKTDLGDTIAWSYLVTNTGTVTLTAVAVNDPKAGAVICPDTTLAPGAGETCVADAAYAITQADVDAGVVNNTATASGTPPQGTPLTSGPSSTSTPITQDGGVTIVKSATVNDVNGDGKTDLSDTIAWSYLVTNTGNVTLSSVAVNDPKAGSVTCPLTSLSPGQSETCTADNLYLVIQADVDAGVVNNTATGTADPPQGPPLTSPPSSTSTPVNQTSGISIVKSATVNGGSGNKLQLGDTITWSYLVTNTGTTTLADVTVTDPVAGGTTCPDPTLAPGASETCTAKTVHTVTQADVNAGVVNNTATASGTSPGELPINSGPSSTSTPVIQTPAISIVKSATVSGVAAGGKAGLGDVISWSYLVSNTGNTTLTDITVSDPTGGPTTCPDASLNPGQSETCKANATHTITQADVNAGQVSDTATAGGTPPSGVPITSPPSSVTVTITPIAPVPAPPAPSNPVQQVLAYTGMDNLAGKLEAAILMIGAGMVLIALSRLRRRTRRAAL